ncbi:ATP-binding protein [Candidatus Woesearchaeota archaeon]|nr:ATP-binding protein [Candidatus Woesearchaeota archaeon]
MINKENLSEFRNLLEKSSLKANDKKALSFAIEFMEGRHDINLSSKSFLLTGEPGVGKTHLVQSFLNIFDIPVIYHGCSAITHNRIISCSSLEKAIEELSKHERFLIFIDDLSYVFKYSEFDEISAGDRKDFMKIADLLKSSDKRVLFFATANQTSFLDESILDRIDVKLEMDTPLEYTKLAFLQARYSEIANKKQISYLAGHSLGYNFRDLPEVIKIAYRQGNGKITLTGLGMSIKEYVPTAMQRYKVLNGIKVNFSSVIGKEKIKSELQNVIVSIKRKNLAKKLGLKRHNLFVFDGPVGTGKTFMVKALAGELKFPIINIRAHDFLSRNSYNTIQSLGNFAKRFENCIIFVDEADKLIGKGNYDEDSVLDGQMNEIFDGIESITNALVIIAVNNSMRFGAGFWDRFAAIKFEMPNKFERREFCRNLLGKLKADVNYDEVARLTEGMSYRDIEKVCNNVFYSILQGRNEVNMPMISEAVKCFRPGDAETEIFG